LFRDDQLPFFSPNALQRSFLSVFFLRSSLDTWRSQQNSAGRVSHSCSSTLKLAPRFSRSSPFFLLERPVFSGWTAFSVNKKEFLFFFPFFFFPLLENSYVISFFPSLTCSPPDVFFLFPPPFTPPCFRDSEEGYLFHNPLFEIDFF